MVSDNDEVALRAATASLLRSDVISFTRVLGSGNNRIYRVQTTAGAYACKSYAERPGEHVGRLEREFAACRFLQAQPGWLVPVPQAVAVDYDRHFGLYEWLDGASPQPRGAEDLRQLAAAVVALREISRASEAKQLMTATEATLSAEIMRIQILRRMEALSEVRGEEPALDQFLRRSFEPLLKAADDNLRCRYASAELVTDTMLAPDMQVLSPSDFGLHNSLRLPDGRLAFLDFEYFGWDDPVRLIVDVLCHPAMQLTLWERQEFFARAGSCFMDSGHFRARLQGLAPLIALRWALIVLNEFLPVHWARRQSAGHGGDWSEVKRAQLDKALGLLGLCREFLVEDWHL